MSISDTLLEAFVALEDSMSFTQAAERCNVTQSAFSQMIRRMETDLNVRLFDRDTRSVRLTPAGTLFSVRARRILQEIRAAQSEMRDYADLKMGRLSLAIVPSLAASWLPQILDEYTKRHPRVSVDVFDTYPERGREMLKDARVEMVIGTEPGAAGDSDVRRLFREPFLLACKEGHPIARKRLIRFEDFEGLPMMHPMHMANSRVVVRGSLQKIWQFLRAARTGDTGIVVEHFATLHALVRAGMGMTLVPNSHAPLVPTGVALVPIDSKALLREVYLTVRKQQSLSVAAQSFVEIMDRHVAAMSL